MLTQIAPTVVLLAAAVLLPRGRDLAAAVPVISDVHSNSFAVSWVTTSPRRGSVDVQVGKKWVSINDERGNVRSTTHLIAVPCAALVRSCTVTLQAKTTYSVRIHGAANGMLTLHARTTPVLLSTAPLAAIGGHVVDSNHRAVRGALIYVVAHHGGQSSLPLATLTLSNGGWLVTLAYAVTARGSALILARGDHLTIRARRGSVSGRMTAGVTSLVQPMLLRQSLVVR